MTLTLVLNLCETEGHGLCELQVAGEVYVSIDKVREPRENSSLILGGVVLSREDVHRSYSHSAVLKYPTIATYHKADKKTGLFSRLPGRFFQEFRS